MLSLSHLCWKEVEAFSSGYTFWLLTTPIASIGSGYPSLNHECSNICKMGLMFVRCPNPKCHLHNLCLLLI